MLAQRGYDLLINYPRSEQEAERSAAACREAGADVLVLRGDVFQDVDCRAMAQGAVARWGRIVWLVDGAKTVTGELVLLDSGMHLGGIRSR
jgi:3-oxoacyl-[acyl-carrier protein] reductase